jgi:uncharacterized protein (TIGR00251 family)
MHGNGDRQDETLRFDAVVRPGASADSITVSGRDLRIEVREKPERGAANRAVLKLVAREFGVNTEQVRIVKGLKSRRKVITIRR